VEALRDAVTSRGGPLDVATAAGRRLFARLFPGAAGTTARASRRLLICPDSLLWDVPFAALVTNPTGKPRYLGEVPISYTQSLTLLRDFRSTAAAAAPAHPLALIVGNPRFNPGAEEPRLAQGRPGEREYLLNGRPPAPLPGPQKEAAAIAGLYGTAPLTGAACTEAEVRTRIGQADVVHLATHGYLNPGRAMSSGLLLALPETPKDEAGRDRDGVLQAWEIFGELKLRADLVVLSACETGRGRTSPGDGIVGLTRALQYAGARSVIASQWRVSDASTGKLMVELHRKLRSGLPKDRALAAAMATLRSSPETAHPYFWAPFLLVGDVDNHLARGR
ncbi:MAG: CHAT domain-containing protein, partial [Actinomycetota bacterium]